jgi:hypothetical protein
MKTCDTTYTLNFTADGNVAATMACLNIVPRDTSTIGRIGKQIVMKAIQIRGHIVPFPAAPSAICVLMLVYVRSNNLASTLPAWSEIMTAQDIIGLTNRDNAGKFKILRRWNYVMTGNDSAFTTNTDLTRRFVDEYITFKKPLVAKWSSASQAGTIGEFEKGSLLLISVGEQPTSAPTTIHQFDFKSRLYFTESDGYMF